MRKCIPLALALLICVLALPACATQENDGISEKRVVETAQLYDDAAGMFSLNGYAPGEEYAKLQSTPGYLQDEPVVFHRLSAKLTYLFHDELLYGVSYEFSLQNLDVGQWTQTVQSIYSDLNGNFQDFTRYDSGSLCSTGTAATYWYAGTSETWSMLVFKTVGVETSSDNEPSSGGESSSAEEPSITITIITDIPNYTKATASYQQHFKPADDALVDVEEWIPSIFVDLMYASSDNFTGEVIYDFHTAYLRYGTVEKLIGVQKKLHQQGYSLKICDAFRPVDAQFKLWEIVPNPNFVADPYHGYSTHSRGNTVDVTLVTLDGSPVEMPTEVDTFSPLADRDYSDVSENARSHAMILQNAMVDAGFKTSSVEWWHYYDTVSYPVAKDFMPED